VALSTRQAIDIIQGIKGTVVGADIVEFNPRMDPQKSYRRSLRQVDKGARGENDRGPFESFRCSSR